MTQTYIERVAKMPKELQEIMADSWDITGRPHNDVHNPLSRAVIAVLDKNAVAGGKEFMADMKIMFPEMTDIESATYYNVYIAGMEKIRDMLASN